MLVAVALAEQLLAEQLLSVLLLLCILSPTFLSVSETDVDSEACAAMYDNRALVWIFRLGVFVGLLSAVVTVIYLTPVPGKNTCYCNNYQEAS